MFTVRCLRNNRVVIAQEFAGEEFWTVGEDDVVFGETFLRSLR